MNNPLAQNFAHLNLLLVDDHPLFLEGLQLILENHCSKTTLLCAHSLAEAKQLITINPTIDLVLLDLNLPDGKGLSLIQTIRAQGKFIPCVVLSASEDAFDVKTALKAGASGFISKAAGGQNLIGQISTVLAGGRCLPDFYPKDGCNNEEALPLLTPRQTEVLQLLSEGLPNKSICQKLDLTEHTVKSHIKALFKLLEVHTRTECVHIAQQLGLIA